MRALVAQPWARRRCRRKARPRRLILRGCDRETPLVQPASRRPAAAGRISGRPSCTDHPIVQIVQIEPGVAEVADQAYGAGIDQVDDGGDDLGVRARICRDGAHEIEQCRGRCHEQLFGHIRRRDRPISCARTAPGPRRRSDPSPRGENHAAPWRLRPRRFFRTSPVETMNDVGSARPRRARAGRRHAVSGRGERDRPSESPKRQLGPGDDRSSGGGTAGQGGHRLRAHRPRRRSSRVPAW